MRRKNYPPIEYVGQCLREQDGQLYWKVRPLYHFSTPGFGHAFNRKFSGKEAGYIRVSKSDGKRCMISITYKKVNINILRNVIIWSLHNGRWPTVEEQLDHENRKTTDDNINNLRLCSQSQNLANSKIHKNNTSGYKGVSYRKNLKKWISFIRHKGKTHYLGCFDNPQKAHEAYLEAASIRFGEFSHNGK